MYERESLFWLTVEGTVEGTVESAVHCDGEGSTESCVYGGGSKWWIFSPSW